MRGQIWNSPFHFLISQPKHMLWVLKRTVSIRRFFWAPKTYVTIILKRKRFTILRWYFFYFIFYLNLWCNLSFFFFFQNYSRGWIHEWRQQTVQACSVQQYDPIIGRYYTGDGNIKYTFRCKRKGGKSLLKINRINFWVWSTLKTWCVSLLERSVKCQDQLKVHAISLDRVSHIEEYSEVLIFHILIFRST